MTDPTPRRTRRGDPVTADEPMSTPDSGGLREAWAHVVRDHDMPPNKDSHAYGYRMGWWDAVVYLDKILTRGLRSCDDCPGPLAAHPEPVSTPDSAADATVGEREVESGRWIGKAAEPNVEPSAQGDKTELVAILDAPLGWDYGARERANAVLRSDWLVQREEAAFRSGYEAGYKQRTEDAEYEEAEADDDTVGESHLGPHAGCDTGHPHTHAALAIPDDDNEAARLTEVEQEDLLIAALRWDQHDQPRFLYDAVERIFTRRGIQTDQPKQNAMTDPTEHLHAAHDDPDAVIDAIEETFLAHLPSKALSYCAQEDINAGLDAMRERFGLEESR